MTKPASPGRRIIADAQTVADQLRRWPRGAGPMALAAVCSLTEGDARAALGYLFGQGRVVDQTDDGVHCRWVRVDA